MNASDWVTLVVGLIGTGGLVGAGARGIGTLTRIAISAEQAGKVAEDLGVALKEIAAQVQAHQVTLAEHGQQLTQLQGAPTRSASAMP